MTHADDLHRSFAAFQAVQADGRDISDTLTAVGPSERLSNLTCVINMNDHANDIVKHDLHSVWQSLPLSNVHPVSDMAGVSAKDTLVVAYAQRLRTKARHVKDGVLSIPPLDQFLNQFATRLRIS